MRYHQCGVGLQSKETAQITNTISAFTANSKVNAGKFYGRKSEKSGR